jgi:hypothetical protein
MKKPLTGLAIFGGVAMFGYAIYYYVRKQMNLLQNYTYKITNFTINSLDLQKIKGDITVQFTSSSDIEVVIQEFYLDFYFNGEKVGYITDNQEFILPARASTEIPLSFTINPQIVFANATDILAYALKTKDASISVRGYAKLKSNFVRLSLPIEYDTTLSAILSS